MKRLVILAVFYGFFPSLHQAQDPCPDCNKAWLVMTDLTTTEDGNRIGGGDRHPQPLRPSNLTLSGEGPSNEYRKRN